MAPGVNLVVPLGCAVAHAEMVAIVIAQRLMGTHDLGGAGLPPFELVTSTEPCAMCLGALPWSGIRRLACGARDEDARAVGFDEGDKPANWPGLLERRGIGVTRDVRRGEAAAVLRQYVDNGGPDLRQRPDTKGRRPPVRTPATQDGQKPRGGVSSTPPRLVVCPRPRSRRRRLAAY